MRTLEQGSKTALFSWLPVDVQVFSLCIWMKLRSGFDTNIVRRIGRMMLTFPSIKSWIYTVSVSARVASHSPDECSHFVFHREFSFSHSFLSVRSHVYESIASHIRLRWLKTVSCTFQDVDSDGSLLPLFIN